MARTRAGFGDKSRLSDYLSVGVLAQACPQESIDRILATRGKTRQRERDLPAYAVVYYVMALALYAGVAYGEVLRCLMEGMQFLRGPERVLADGSDLTTGTPMPRHEGLARAG